MRNLLILIAFSCSLLCGQAAMSQNAVPDNIERAALLSIYNSTDGQEWIATRRWSLTRIASYPNPDSVLFGVQVENGDITSIQLDQITGMTGTLPAELNDLTELQFLSFGSNNLSGTLTDLSQLTKLKTLNLSNCDFSGNFPAWLGSLINIESMNLSGNQFAGTLPLQISQLTKLHYFGLSGNNLSASEAIPPSFAQLDQLQTLELQSCLLTPSSVSTGLTGLANLVQLNLNNNPSFVLGDGTLPDVLINLPNLLILQLGSNSFTLLPANFDELPKLNYLNLSGNNYSDNTKLAGILDTLQNVPTLRILLLTGCSISSLPTNMNLISQVENLYLTSNPLQTGQWEAIGDMAGLKNLYVQNCNITELAASLVDIISLEGIYAFNNDLYPIPTLLQNIQNLKALDLGANEIQALPSWFGSGNMNSLTYLSLNNNQITLPLPNNFANLVNLTTLSMSSNQFEGVLPSFFSTFTEMNYLNLSFNELTLPLPDLSSWTNLNQVYLQHNNFVGAVPGFLSNIPVSKSFVDLSFNRFNELTPFSSASNLRLYVNNNRLDFTNILKVQRPIAEYRYIPQDTVVSAGGEPEDVEAYLGSPFTLTTPVDTATTPRSVYQWFKLDENGNPVPVSPPSEDNHTYTVDDYSEEDAGDYYCVITNPAAPGLTLITPIVKVKTSPCVTNAPVGFTHKNYVCAIIFEPLPNTRQCVATTFNWNFGDGATSTERKPAHGYDDPGTYNITLTIRYKCGTACQTDTTIQKQITFDPTQEVLKDTLIQVITYAKQKVLSASAASFADAWPLQHLIPGLDTINSFEKGTQGVWRNEGAYVYNVPRTQSAATNIATDGSFTLEQFNWQQAELNAIPSWTKANSITQYSPFSYELENRDVLGIYSAALYDYGGHLPSANGVNMRFNEMAFTSFEFLDNQSTGNWIFGSQAVPDYDVYEVDYGYKNMAVIKTHIGHLEDVEVADVTARRLFQYGGPNSASRQTYSIENDEVVCKQVYEKYAGWSVIVLKDAPIISGIFGISNIWSGQIKVRREVEPTITPTIDNTIAHSGKSSLRIAADQIFKQELLHLDSGKSYVINAWVSVNNAYVTIPKLADSLGIDVIVRNSNDQVIATFPFRPSGHVIEGWQQVKGKFVFPSNSASIELRFKPGSTGTAWYDDLRFHPEKGNMKCYVYDLKDYRLKAVLDEENFASFFYYDEEGNLHLTKRETERGIKTLTENLNYQVERGN